MVSRHYTIHVIYEYLCRYLNLLDRVHARHYKHSCCDRYTNYGVVDPIIGGRFWRGSYRPYPNPSPQTHLEQAVRQDLNYIAARQPRQVPGPCTWELRSCAPDVGMYACCRLRLCASPPSAIVIGRPGALFPRPDLVQASLLQLSLPLYYPPFSPRAHTHPSAPKPQLQVDTHLWVAFEHRLSCPVLAFLPLPLPLPPLSQPPQLLEPSSPSPASPKISRSCYWRGLVVSSSSIHNHWPRWATTRAK